MDNRQFPFLDFRSDKLDKHYYNSYYNYHFFYLYSGLDSSYLIISPDVITATSATSTATAHAEHITTASASAVATTIAIQVGNIMLYSDITLILAIRT
ncbi:MAG: hypothetical protein IJQ34_06560 [Kiritimatiellae bacterium]|nr:hypothetical protein [Kiritimatiellia bacterium]